MTDKITAPFTDNQVTALNAYQRHGRFHPFTCGSGDRMDGAHDAYKAAHDDGDWGLLIATSAGWRCPACDYTQDWAHTFMADPKWSKP